MEPLLYGLGECVRGRSSSRLGYHGKRITVPTEGDIPGIKGVLILIRSATQGYLDFVALVDHMGNESVFLAPQLFDRLCRHARGESQLKQLQVQLADALPYDLEKTELSEYKNLDSRWHDWQVVKMTCSHLAAAIFDRVCNLQEVRSGHRRDGATSRGTATGL